MRLWVVGVLVMWIRWCLNRPMQVPPEFSENPLDWFETEARMSKQYDQWVGPEPLKVVQGGSDLEFLHAAALLGYLDTV